MADKFRKTAPIRITFAQGEQPTHSKLNVLGEQSRNALALVEKAIGDPWGQSGDSALSAYPLQIPNLARTMGESKYLNPAIYPVSSFRFYEHLETLFDGKTEGYFKFLPNPTSSVTQSTGTSFGTLVAEEYLVLIDGDFWVDDTTGRFRTFTPIASDEVVYYTVDPADWSIGAEILPSVIPDPRQTTFTGCRLQKSGDSYYIHLPPRIALSAWFGDNDEDRPASYPTAAEFSDNYATATGSPNKFWQSPSVDALNDAHYRYPIPSEIDGLSVGDIVPGGFMLLWDQANGTIVEDVSFKVTATAWIFEVITSTQEDLLVARAGDPGDETESSYNDPALSVILCGAPISKKLWALASSFFTHAHDHTGLASIPVSHNNLDDMNPPTSDYTDHSSRYPTNLPVWPASNWFADRHTSLLSRGGSQTTRQRDSYNNAMLGHIILANADPSTPTTALDGTTPDSSYKLYFGDTDGGFIYSDSNARVRIGVAGSSKIHINSDPRMALWPSYVSGAIPNNLHVAYTSNPSLGLSYWSSSSVNSGDTLGIVAGKGKAGGWTLSSEKEGAKIKFVAADTWADFLGYPITTPGQIEFYTTGAGTTISAPRWTMQSAGHYVPYTNNSYDIGETSYKVRSIYASTLYVTDISGYTGGALNLNGPTEINLKVNNTSKWLIDADGLFPAAGVEAQIGDNTRTLNGIYTKGIVSTDNFGLFLLANDTGGTGPGDPPVGWHIDKDGNLYTFETQSLGTSSRRIPKSYLFEIDQTGASYKTVSNDDDGQAYTAIWLRNTSGEIIQLGSWVMGSLGEEIQTIKAGQPGVGNGKYFLGVAVDDIAVNEWGWIAITGMVNIKLFQPIGAPSYNIGEAMIGSVSGVTGDVEGMAMAISSGSKFAINLEKIPAGGLGWEGTKLCLIQTGTV